MSDNTTLKLVEGVDLSKLEEVKELCYNASSTFWNATKTYCNRIFDGLQCWKDTLANTTVSQECPDYVEGFDPTQSAFRTCREDGTWSSHPETYVGTTNYSNCVSDTDMSLRNTYNTIYLGGYVFSTFVLMLSLLIFWVYRSTVQCTRVRVHVNLFLAVIITNIFWIVWYLLVINDSFVVMLNPVWCQVMHVVTYYTLMTSYLWMFCEGMHLYLSIAFVYSQKKDCMLMFFGIGWLSPAAFMAIYSALRIHFNQTGNCWTDRSDAFYVISIPVLGFLFISMLFLLNVVYILYCKVQVQPRLNRIVAIIKTVKAAVIVVPLFGLHFMLMPISPWRQHSLLRSYQIATSVVAALQGLLLASIFCFTNLEVIAAFRKLCCSRQQEQGVANIAMTEASGQMHRRRASAF